MVSEVLCNTFCLSKKTTFTLLNTYYETKNQP